MITTMVRGYVANFRNHIFTNFEPRTTDLGGVSVANRRRLAKYAYDRAATGEGNGPVIHDNPFGQDYIDNFAAAIDLGPTPVTTATLEAQGNLYLPWLYQVLQRLEARVFIQEPVPQRYASRAYVHRKLKDVSEFKQFFFNRKQAH
jgi:hypothetical protein